MAYGVISPLLSRHVGIPHEWIRQQQLILLTRAWFREKRVIILFCKGRVLSALCYLCLWNRESRLYTCGYWMEPKLSAEIRMKMTKKAFLVNFFFRCTKRVLGTCQIRLALSPPPSWSWRSGRSRMENEAGDHWLITQKDVFLSDYFI